MLTLLVSVALATNVTVLFFWGIGCPHCAAVKQSGVLEKVSQYAEVKQLEVYRNTTNRELLLKLWDEYNVPVRGVPVAFINCSGNVTYIVGDRPIIENLEKQVMACLAGNFSGKATVSESVTRTNGEITWPIVITAAAFDSINPCAFAVLSFLLVSLTKARHRKKILVVGIAYSIAIYITYFLAGVGIFKGIEAFASFSHYIYVGAAIIAIIAGILDVKDFFAFGVGPQAAIPKKARPFIFGLSERVATAGTILGVLGLGFVVALFELPCTGGVYLALLALIAKYGVNAYPYLLVYNLIFILPLIGITAIAYFFVDPQRIEAWRSAHKNWLELVLGIFLIGLGIAMLLNVV